MQSKTQDELVQENIAKIDGWKERHKTVKAVTLNSKYNGRVPYIIGKPTNSMIDAVSKYSADGKPNKIEELMINSCVLAGDKDLLKEDVDLKTALLGQVSDLLEKLEVEAKEL